MSYFAILNCGTGNLRSVQKVFERLGAQAEITNDIDRLQNATGLVLPGVGAFKDAIAILKQDGLDTVLRGLVSDAGKPIIGICLGMQLLARTSEEDGNHDGLALIPATVRRLKVSGLSGWNGRQLTLPHIGWSEIAPRPGSILFEDVPTGSDVYFVHSYAVAVDDGSIVSASATYGEKFAAAIETGNIFATQFHPEKSQQIGHRIIGNFVTYCTGASTSV